MASVPSLNHHCGSCNVNALSPLDGRYASRVAPLREHLSEAALIRHRIAVEIAWLLALCDEPQVTHVGPLAAETRALVLEIVPSGPEATVSAAMEVKRIERSINHDVKAVEYYVKDQLRGVEGFEEAWVESVHFALTSEDVNNVAYAGMFGRARGVLLGQLGELCCALEERAVEWASIPMLARTHGQPASPTTLGKEMANFAHRLRRHERSVRGVRLQAKMNGAIGCYNAHLAAYPGVDWPAVSAAAIASLGWDLEQNPFTTQIEPHESIAELFDALARVCTTVTDLARDCWGYISLGYLKQRIVGGEVGSSTMPHKVNPIDFENGEGNAGLAVAILTHLARKLPVSRFQRDLTDSTVLRSVGTAFAHVSLALTGPARGLSRVAPNEEEISRDLMQHWEVLAEPVQTVFRRYGIEGAYETLKAATRTGGSLDSDVLGKVVDAAEGVPEEEMARMKTWTPSGYTGNAEITAKKVAGGE